MYQNLLFEHPYDVQLTAFYNTPLGKLYQAIPFEAMSKQVPVPQRAISDKGCKPWLDVKGGIGLQILKSYYRCSDAMLVEQLNGNWQMQMFCGILLKPGEQIKDKDLVGRWRSFLSRKLDMDKLQMSCVQHWKPFMDHTHTGFCDATVYESYIEYPTDAKLLWKSCCDVYQMIKYKRKELKLRHTRINHEKRKIQYLSFAKRRKKSRRQSKKVCKLLLKYLVRLMEQLDELLQQHKAALSGYYNHRLSTIIKVKEQQWQLHFGKQATVPNRIVSLHKPYVRPIVRGKEVKPVEFGAKVNMLLVDGISFIENLSYDNFNEGTRLQSTINLQQRYFGACHQMGADAIYGTNENRRYCTINNIATSFIPKGNEGKLKEQKSQMRSILGKIRSTVLEGSFGNEKNHYQMNKIKAKTQGNEKVWIFFSLMSCNAMQIAKRMQPAKKSDSGRQLQSAA
ncbi:MAG: transposase [Gloeobacteraceae cyanobacterium ES-bin-316]|nr:transposase [Ferruginibacter sp.]